MEKKIQIDPMITHTMPLADINKGFDLMHAGKSIRSVDLLTAALARRGASSLDGEQSKTKTSRRVPSAPISSCHRPNIVPGKPTAVIDIFFVRNTWKYHLGVWNLLALGS